MPRDPGPARTVPTTYSPLAAFLSYLVPGLGQVSQGRVAKGLVFFACIYLLFFYGMALGNWSNVYLPDLAEEHNPWGWPTLPANFYNRPQFLGQFWVGIAAWPAVVQYAQYDRYAEEGPVFGTYMRMPYETRSDYPADSTDPSTRRQVREQNALKASQALKDWPGRTLNEMQTEGDRTWELGWVFTVIAGVLNILVIYDALAGPAFVVTAPAGPAPDK